MNNKIAFIKSKHKDRILKVLKHVEVKHELTDKQKARIQNRIQKRKKEQEDKLQKELEKAIIETEKQMEKDSPAFKKIMGEWRIQYKELVVAPMTRQLLQNFGTLQKAAENGNTK